MLYDRIGTVAYMAPELVSTENIGHSSKVDIWALGVLTFYLLSGGHMPFDTD